MDTAQSLARFLQYIFMRAFFHQYYLWEGGANSRGEDMNKQQNKELKQAEDKCSEEAYRYNCGGHCKLCPFPGFKCNGRPSKAAVPDS